MTQQKISVSFMLTGILFNVCLITANLLETKVIEIFGITITGGLLVFPLSYIFNDCITEVWGFKKARLIIWTGFAMNLLLVLFGLLAVSLPAAPGWEGSAHFNYVFKFAPRVFIASMLAFLIGSFINAYIMSRMKVASNGKNFSLRALVSTVFGETADSLVFFPIAFGGVIQWETIFIIMGVQIGLKSLYEILILPITSKLVKFLKEMDNSDAFDRQISYNFLKINDL